MATNKQFTKTGASVNVSWSTSRGTDNYTVNVTQPTMPGHFTTTDTSLLLMLDYNVNYTINITAQNCAGSNSTVLSLTIGKIMNCCDLSVSLTNQEYTVEGVIEISSCLNSTSQSCDLGGRACTCDGAHLVQ